MSKGKIIQVIGPVFDIHIRLETLWGQLFDDFWFRIEWSMPFDMLKCLRR